MIRVAIVENEALVREGLRRVLELDPGVRVEGEARDGVEALQLLPRADQSQRPGELIVRSRERNHVKLLPRNDRRDPPNDVARIANRGIPRAD